MKVTEIRKDNRTGKTFGVSWGDNITSDFSIITSVARIIEGLRDQEEGKAQPGHPTLLDRYTTIAIDIEL